MNCIFSAARTLVLAEQLDTLPDHSSFRGTSTGPAIERAWELTEWFRRRAWRAPFLTSGCCDSVETALRLARRYHCAKLRSLGSKRRLPGGAAGHRAPPWSKIA
jgi:adenosylmethionine-8-amino-7-oxononanoate aminotransferase